VHLRLLFALFFVIANTLPGQQINASPDAPEFRVNRTERTFATLTALKEFEAVADPTYLLGAGDDITVDVWERPEVSGKHSIGPDGTISIPIAGPISMIGLSRDAAAAAIAKSLRSFYTVDLGVVVRVDRYAANRILVLGRVSSPGVLSFDTPPTLLEAVTRAGGLPIGGIGADKATLSRVAVFRGRDRVVWVDLSKILDDGNLAYNIRLQRNDLLYIPDANDQMIYVLGEVEKPGAYGVTPNMSLIDAVALAGGPTEDANAKRIQVLRPSTGLERTIALQDLVSPTREVDFALQDGDVVYVPRRGLAKVGYTLQKLSPFTGLLVFMTALTNSR
jgi:polysaccharide biosynthesis/export protein